MTSSSLTLSAALRRALIAQAVRERPLECCGLLVGTNDRVLFAVPMKNVAGSEVRYRIDERAHIDVRRVLRGTVPPLSICGVYHSHPDGPAVPSPTDIAEAHYPDWAYVIIGLGRRQPSVQAFRIRDGRARRLTLR